MKMETGFWKMEETRRKAQMVPGTILIKSKTFKME